MKAEKWDWSNFKKTITATGRVLPIVQSVALREDAEGQALRDNDWLHPSEICKKSWCPRASFYHLSGDTRPPRNHMFSSLNVFAEGHLIHDKWQRWLDSAGVLRGRWKCRVCGFEWEDQRTDACDHCGANHGGWYRYKEVPIFNAEYGIIGHADGLIEDAKGRALVEIKSIGIGTLRFEDPDLFRSYQKNGMTLDQLWAAIRYPFESHIKQAQLYMHCTDVHTIVFIYESKWNQQVKEFTVHYNHSKIADILRNCLAVRTAVGRNLPPIRPSWATDSSCSGCKECPYLNTCWKVTNEDRQTTLDPADGLHPVSEVSGGVPLPSSTGSGDTGHPATPRRLVRRQPDGPVR